MSLPNWAYYTQPEYDSFGWNPMTHSTIDPAESHGLDYESARDATPCWYGVSFGDGNDGVSQLFPDYYVRTADPFKLAAAAMISTFKDEWKERAADAIEVDGEADYTISATIYNPEDVEGYPDGCPNCGATNDKVCECESGPAWSICEVFRVDDMPGAVLPDGTFVQYNPFDKPAYVSLESAFDETELRLAG